jgi:endonuclease/exonuclease/phosphatase family metal-dependent hydrolase
MIHAGVGMIGLVDTGESMARVRVLTWNVWWRFGPAWRERQPVLLRRLREADADVIALQECWGDSSTTQAHEFAAALGMHAGFAAPGLPPAPYPPESPDQAEVEVGIGVVSRWPLTSIRAVDLPARHRTPAPVAAVAEVAHPAGPLHVVIACLEWEPAYTDDRIAQAHAVVDLATDPATDGSLPVILCGDLNAAPDSPVLRPVYDVLIDTWSAGGGDPGVTTLPSDHPHAPLELTELIDRRIDHIFIRPGQPGVQLAVESVAVLGDAVDGLHPSDHLGVVCDLTWTAMR